VRHTAIRRGSGTLTVHNAAIDIAKLIQKVVDAFGRRKQLGLMHAINHDQIMCGPTSDMNERCGHMAGINDKRASSLTLTCPTLQRCAP
jgi:hypothetical protein